MLENCDLSGVNLHSNDTENGWDLSNCTFDGSNLSSARIVHAKLIGASLRGADLTGACLAHSVLMDADLTGVRMARADFRGVKKSCVTLRPSVVTCALCRGDARVDHQSSTVELRCSRCVQYFMRASEFERLLWGELEAPSVAEDRTAATAALDYTEFVRRTSEDRQEVRLERCVFCSEWSCRALLGYGRWSCACRSCGLYELAGDTPSLTNFNAHERLKICWRLRERFDEQVLADSAPKPVSVDARLLSDISASLRAPDDPLDCLRLLVGWIQARSRPDGGYVQLREADFAVAHADSRAAMRYLLDQATGLGWIEQLANEGWRLTLNGWKQALEWKRKRPDARQVFVAMSFDPQFHPARDALAAAIREVGLTPMRMDQIEHNDKICDRLVAEIRRSRLVIADCSQGSGNVYFEAGFALGLGLTVIWTCRESEKDELKFDTRQYAHILWKDPEELRRKLVDRLNATLLPVA